MSHTYEEPDDLRRFPAAVRVYSYVLHVLEPFDESSDPVRQLAAQRALGTADRNLVARAGEFVDPATNELDTLSIRRYVIATIGYKCRDAAQLTGPSLDASEPGQLRLAERLSRDTHALPTAHDEGALSDLELREAELDELRAFAAELSEEREAADLGPRIVREWAEAHPGELTADDADILELRARGLDYWAIADVLRPAASADPAERKRVRDWARARASRARPKLPAEVAEQLPASNKNGRSPA